MKTKSNLIRKGIRYGLFSIALAISGSNYAATMPVSSDDLAGEEKNNPNALSASPPCTLTPGFTFTLLQNGQVNVASTSTGTTSNTFYMWNWGDNSATQGVNQASQGHQYPTFGTYVITLTIQDTIGVPSCSATIAQTVTPTAPCNTSIIPDFVAVGSMPYGAVVSNQCTGTTSATSYLWDFGNGTTSTTSASMFNLTYSSAGNYAIKLKTFDGGCTDSITKTVHICGPLTAALAYTLGSGGMVTYSNTSTGMMPETSRQWFFSGSQPIPGGQLMNHLYTNGGIHWAGIYVSDTVSNQCSDFLYQQPVNITSVPCVSNSSFSLSYSGFPGVWYAVPAYMGNVSSMIWSWGDGNTDTLTSPIASYSTVVLSHNYSAAGMYNICQTVTTSCGTSSTCINSNIFKQTGNDNAMVTIHVLLPSPIVTGLATHTEENATVNLYPNPNNGSFRINMENVGSENVEISVYNILGEKVYSTNGKVSNGNVRSEINTENLSNGTYYIQVKSDARSYNLKTIINK